MSVCATTTDLGVVRDVLTAVNCNTKSFARLGYESLTAAGSPFQAALTVALTIYVAVIGYRLLFGNGARLADGPTIALKIAQNMTVAARTCAVVPVQYCRSPVSGSSPPWPPTAVRARVSSSPWSASKVRRFATNVCCSCCSCSRPARPMPTIQASATA